MNNFSNIRHVVVTPSRNESEFLPDLVESMTRQTIIPSEWIIVAHNSDSNSQKILEEISSEHNWIKWFKMDDESKRRRGAQIAEVVNFGLSNSETEWDFFSKIDSDMSLPPDYFENIFTRFSEVDGLGIASGSCFLIENGKKSKEEVALGHTRGGLKTYKLECFNEIGGIREVDGWDGIDNITAQMKNWKTRSFDEIAVHHQRRTGSFFGLIPGCFETGKFAYSMRYYPLFMLVRCIHRMARKPLILGGISMFFGYATSFFRRNDRLNDLEITTFLREKQKKRLKHWR